MYNQHINMCHYNTSTREESYNFSELKFCFCNIGGLKGKLEDDMFQSEIKQNGIVLLSETHVGHNLKIIPEGFHCFQVCISVCNGRLMVHSNGSLLFYYFYGGLAVFI